MKYNITINQKSVIDNGLLGELDIIDLAIFDFIYHFFNSDFEDKVTFTKNGIEYTEIRPALLEREMPLLKIGTKRTFINRMNNLINAGLIERYENNSNENRSGYKKGVNFSIFEFDKPKKTDSQGYENNFTPPMKTDSHNNNITNNNKEEIDKSISKKDEKKDIDDWIDKMYSIYPTKCPCRNMSLGKCSKDKERIRKLLKSYTKDQIEKVIRNEVETKYGKSYMSNFSTFLNNFPDPNCIDANINELNSDELKNGNIVINGVEYK